MIFSLKNLQTYDRGSTPINDFNLDLNEKRNFFFLKFLADTCPFLGPLVPLFWISGDISSGFQSQSGLPYSHCGGECNVRSPRSTSGATLADLLVASAQLVLSPHTVAEVRLPGFKLVLSEYL